MVFYPYQMGVVMDKLLLVLVLAFSSSAFSKDLICKSKKYSVIVKDFTSESPKANYMVGDWLNDGASVFADRLILIEGKLSLSINIDEQPNHIFVLANKSKKNIYLGSLTAWTGEEQSARCTISD